MNTKKLVAPDKNSDLCSMNYQKEMQRAAKPFLGILRNNRSHTSEEIVEIGKCIPLMCLKKPALLMDYARKHMLSYNDVMILAVWTDTMRDFMDNVVVNNDISYDAANKAYKSAQMMMITISRLNYILRECMNDVFDSMDDVVTNTSEYRKIESLWKSYEFDGMKKTDKASWYALQDCLRLTYDSVSGVIDKLREMVTAYFTRADAANPSLIAACAVALLMGKSAKVSYDEIFKMYRDETGVDFSRCFSYYNLSGMTTQFAYLCKGNGMGVERDDDGCWKIKEFSLDDDIHSGKTWRKLIAMLRDDDYMDKSAIKAFNLNPEVKKEYERLMHEN